MSLVRGPFLFLGMPIGMARDCVNVWQEFQSNRGVRAPAPIDDQTHRHGDSDSAFTGSPGMFIWGNVHVYMYMATKTISITKEAYDRLRARKGPEESFSDVILRLTERRPLAEYAGMLSKSSVKAMREAIEEARRERRRLDVRA